jgi:hypothetical protein
VLGGHERQPDESNVSRPQNENTREDRRRDVRVVASGSVVVRGRSASKGRIVDLSTGGVCIEIADQEPAPAIADVVALELRLDRAESRWLTFHGRVLRIAGARVAIAFMEAPIAFGDVMSRAIASAIEAVATTHVLLVDADLERRAAFAALMRRADCRVAEASTPLEAIAHLGGSAIETWVIAIADTRPPSVANELRRFLSGEYPQLEVVSLGALSPKVALMRLFRSNSP